MGDHGREPGERAEAVRARRAAAATGSPDGAAGGADPASPEPARRATVPRPATGLRPTGGPRPTTGQSIPVAALILDLPGDPSAASRPAARRAVAADALAAFLAEDDDLRALVRFLDLDPGAAPPRDVAGLRARLAVASAELGDRLAVQLDAVLHAGPFQRLEASWRSLGRLVERVWEHERVRVRLLDLSWRELANDLARAIEFDQSQFFRKVYTEEFDTPGGEPFGLLVGDYALGAGATSLREDVRTLELATAVAAAAFAPLVLAAGAPFFGLDDLAALERPADLRRVFEQAEYAAWRELRRKEDARFACLTVPRVLLRRPYRPSPTRSDGFPYREHCGGGAHGYLWGSAAFALAEVVARDFGQSGWTGAIRGVVRDREAGGVVTGLVSDRFDTDRSDAAAKAAVEVQLTDEREQELSRLGFLPLSHCAATPFAAFHGSSTIQRPERYDDPVATTNARLSSQLHSILCVSRFAHYVKLIGRDKVGSFETAERCQAYLNDWLAGYCTAGDDLTPETKARFPLREGRVEVRPLPGRPGVFGAVVHLRPHYQLDQLAAAVRLTTELAPVGA